MNQFPSKNFFTLPNEIFSLGLGAGEIAVYAYLRCLEKPQHLPVLAQLHYDRQRSWPRKEYGHAVRRCACRERSRLHRANLCPDEVGNQKERQPALHHPTDP